MSQKVNLNAYFERIGFAGSIAPTLATLEQINALHPAAICFENLDPVMGRPVKLDQPSLEQKLLHDRRGGYCFEHNTMLMNVLRDLDYIVRPYAARILWEMPEGGARLISHMVLVVEVGGASYLTDVGMSSFTLTAPIKLREGVEQDIRGDVFALDKQGERWRLSVKRDDEWRGVYQFDLIEQSEADIASIAAVVDGEYFNRALLYAARLDGAVRHTLSGNRLRSYRPGEEREQREAADVAELKAILSDVFRIPLPSDAELDPALERVFAALAPTVD